VLVVVVMHGNCCWLLALRACDAPCKPLSFYSGLALIAAAVFCVIFKSGGGLGFVAFQAADEDNLRHRAYAKGAASL
jgi:hypothetical protein